MNNNQYISNSLRRVAQLLVLGAAIAGVREVKQMSCNIIKIAKEWNELGKEGPIFEFTLANVTEDMKKRMRELKYGRDSFTEEELRQSRTAMASKVTEDRPAGKLPGDTGIITESKAIKAAFDKVRSEILVIEKESWQLRSRMAAIKGN